LYQYHVDFDPQIESKRLRIGLLKQHESLFVNKAFDGMTLYSLTKLDQEVTELKSIRNYDQMPIILKVKLVNQVLPLSAESLRMFNIIFKRCLYHCKLIEFGKDRAYFDFNNTHDIQKYHLKVAAGYKASMDIYENKLLLCTEIAHKLINYDTVWNVMERFYRDSPLESYKKKCIDYLVGQTVMTNYNKKTYKIDDIIWDQKPADSFEKRNGESITFIKYYKEHYNITIREEHQPLLVCLQKNKDKNNKDKPGSDQPVQIKLIPELCALTGNVLLKEFENNFAMKKDLDAITKLNPEVRYSRLRRFLDTLRNQPDAKKDLENWQIDFSSDVIKVNATVLAPITVQFKNQTVSNTERGWNNSLRNSHHLTSIHLKNWILIYFPRDESKAHMFCDELRGVSEPMGFSIERCTMIRLPDSRGSLGGLFASVIREKINSQQPQLVVCIVPNTAKDTYDAIKRTCCIDFGVPSQVVTSNILNMSNMNKTKSVITKLAIQMNCKLGGEIWGVLIPMKNIMIIGMDFYKDSAQKNSSVAAFIASINGVQDNKLNCTKYFSKCHLQPRGNEFADGLQVFMTEALKKYNERNNTLPDRIFVYRDGVSDNQFDKLSEFEIPQMKSAFKAFGENYRPKMTFFVVKKRSNARFFLKGSRNEFQNPPIGTVIDNTITKRKGKEFYLIAQSSNQGTVSPTHFHVIEDENEMPPDRLQIITYRLTHLYFNWPGQIRVPAPCHYAHKLAHLVGESLHRPHSSLLDESLFYL
jgi:aubergine-like protein